MSIPYTEDQSFNVIQIDNFRNLVFGLSEVQLWISGTNVIPNNQFNSINANNAVDGDVTTIWSSPTDETTQLTIFLDQNYDIMDIESFVFHIPDGYQNEFAGTKVVLSDAAGTTKYTNHFFLTYPSIYRFDGPAIENVSTFATSSSNFNSNIPNFSNFSNNMIIQPIVIPYRPQGYAPTELIYTQPSQTKYDIQFQYKHDDSDGLARNLTIRFYIDFHKIFLIFFLNFVIPV